MGRHFSFLSLFLLGFVFLSSCSYKPMAYYGNRALGQSVYVELVVNLRGSEDSVGIKDVVNEAIISKIHSRLVPRDEADVVLEVNVLSLTDHPLSFDEHGFVKFYRADVTIRFSFIRGGKKVSYTNNGYFDYMAYPTDPSLMRNSRSNAVLEAARQSVGKFISQIGYEGTVK